MPEMSNPYTLLANTVRDFVLLEYFPCEYQYKDFESSDGCLGIRLEFNCTEDIADYLKDYSYPEEVQVNFVTSSGSSKGSVFFFTKPGF